MNKGYLKNGLLAEDIAQSFNQGLWTRNNAGAASSHLWLILICF